MKFGILATTTALVIGSITLGSSVTQGQETPHPDDEPRARAATLTKSSGNPASDGVDVSAQLVGGFVFVPIIPYRTYDSRTNFPGRISTDEEQIFTVLTDEFDLSQIPLDAVAVSYNLTVTATLGGGGFLAIYPADAFWPGNSSINWSAPGTTLGNGGTTAIGFWDGDGQIAVMMGAEDALASTDYIVDITGYFIAPIE